jgi:proteic killer suppression protein
MIGVSIVAPVATKHLIYVAQCATYSPSIKVFTLIQGWKTKAAREVFEGRSPKGFPAELVKGARRRLAQLNAARTLDDLKAPPGNRLHPLSGDRKGQWSISVNDQFRICFVWTDNGPDAVEFVDYH